MKKRNEQTYKPSSVVGNHLSVARVASRLMRHYLSRAGNPCQSQGLTALFGLAPNGVYIVAPNCLDTGALLPHLSTCAKLLWQSISVALSLRSPAPDVIRHPALRCPDFPHAYYCTRLPSLLISVLFNFRPRLRYVHRLFRAAGLGYNLPRALIG